MIEQRDVPHNRANSRRIAATVLLSFLAACGSRSASDSGSLYRMQADESHLVIDWPATGSGIPPARFRIPRENLDTGRIRLRSNGQIWNVWILMSAEHHPALLAAYDAIHPAKATTRAAQASKDRKFPHFLLELGSFNNEWVRSRRGPRPDHQLESPYLGMARYSVLLCPEPGRTDDYFRNQVWKDRIANKPEDDFSPDGCLFHRSSSYITNSIPKDLGEDAIDIECMSTCWVNVQVRQRNVAMSVLHEDLPIALELAKAAQITIRGYLVEVGTDVASDAKSTKGI